MVRQQKRNGRGKSLGCRWIRKPPVIVIGMHRSGTGLVTQLLESIGIFMGAIQQGDHESVYHLRMNERVLSVAGIKWDIQGRTTRLHPDCRILRKFKNSIQYRLQEFVYYWAGINWVRFVLARILGNKKGWGWKDPRNMLTLPCWLELFPNAKVIHVVRNGVDVADSLKKREERRIHSRRNWHHHSTRCLSLDGGFHLWEEYVSIGMSYEKNPLINTHRVEFETLLGNVDQVIESLSEFLKVKPNSRKVDKFVKGIKKSRKNAWIENQDLRVFFNKVKNTRWMQEMGYDE